MTTFSLIAGQIPNRRPAAYCWNPTTDNTLNPHIYPMALNSGGVDFGPDTPTLIASYGKTYVVHSGHYAPFAATLLTLPVGRRAFRLNWPNDWVFGNADDRCQDAGGNVVGSATPATNNGIYRDATNGYSNLILEKFIAGIQVWAAAAAGYVAAAGVPTNERLLIASDLETKVDSGSGLKVNSAYRTALYTDPRWATTTLPRLSAIINEATSGSVSSFNSASWDAGDIPHQNAWNAYDYERQAVAMDAVLAGIQTVFPNAIMSTYEHHGRSGVAVNASGTNGGLTDLNGNLYYQPRTNGNNSSDYRYGWMGQQGIKFFNTKARSYWGNFEETDPEFGYGNNPWHALVWDLKRGLADAIGIIAKGGKYLPWLAWMGFDDSDFALGGFGDAGTTDVCPYWEANFAAQALLAGGEVLYWNSRTYFTSGPHPATIDQTNKEFIFSGSITYRVRPGLCSSIKITGSTGNDGVYTVSRIYWDSGANQTHVKVVEAIPNATADGRIDQLPTDANDAVSEVILADLRTHLLLASSTGFPISTTVVATEYDPATGLERCPTGNPITWVAVREGPRAIYCVMIGRSGTIKSAFSAQTVTIYVNGVSTATFVIPANKAYKYYSRPYSVSETLTFTWSQTGPTNLIATQVLTDTGTWTKAGTSITSDATHLSPITGLNSYALGAATAIASFAVTPGKLYTVSVYTWIGHAGSLPGKAIAVLKGSDGLVLGNMSMDVSLVQAGGSDEWQQYYLTFIAPEGETAMKFRLGNTSYANWYCHPMAVQGILPGPPV